MGGCVYEKSSIDKIGQKWFEPHPDQIWLHWSMLMTMTMTMQIVVRLVEADVLLVCLVEDGRISNVACSNNHINDCAMRVEAFPI